jgi:hypothetical protein
LQHHSTSAELIDKVAKRIESAATRKRQNTARLKGFPAGAGYKSPPKRNV